MSIVAYAGVPAWSCSVCGEYTEGEDATCCGAPMKPAPQRGQDVRWSHTVRRDELHTVVTSTPYLRALLQAAGCEIPDDARPETHGSQLRWTWTRTHE